MIFKKIRDCIKFFMGLAIFISLSTVVLSKEYFVSPQGNDANPGTKEQPFKTPEKARDVVRTDELRGSEDIIVWFFGGRYYRDRSFWLDGRDSGSEKAPVTYKALPGERVYWDGGMVLSDYKLSSDSKILKRIQMKNKNKIYEVDLRNLKSENFGKFGPRGFNRKVFPAPAELFINSSPQTIARWPNEGRIELGEVIDKGGAKRWGDSSKRGATFKYEVSRAELWTKANDLYLAGIFSESYADDAIRVAKIDTKEKTITMAEPHLYGFNNRSYTSWYAVNLLEEIDAPGEYYIDKNSKKLYFYPETNKIKMLQISQLDSPMLLLENTSYINFEGIVFENARGNGVVIEDGKYNTIAGCTIRLIGGEGVDIIGGNDNTILSCNIYHTGAGGVSLSGGDRKTLTSSNHVVKNSDIYDVNRWYKTYRSGVTLKGVGQKVINNHIHHMTGQAILFYGNDHLIEFNEINDCVTDMSDMAAIYTGRDPSVLGHIIRYNFFHHLDNKLGSGNGVQAIYFDDDDLYTAVIFGNVFYKAGSNAVLHFNGGGGSSIGNNILIDCPKFMWGGEPERVLKAIQKMHKTDKRSLMKKIFEDVDIREEPFKSRYPYLYKSYKYIFNIGTPNWNNIIIQSNNKEVMKQFVDPENMDFTIKSDAPILKTVANNILDPVYGLYNEDIKFQPIPFEKIGLYEDEYRKDSLKYSKM